MIFHEFSVILLIFIISKEIRLFEASSNWQPTKNHSQIDPSFAIIPELPQKNQ